MEILPAIESGNLTTLKARIRGLQTHRSKVGEAQPGSRTAANLVGVEPEELHRGQVVTTPGWLRLSNAVDVRLRAIASLRRPLRHNLHISFHSYAAETPGRLRLLEDDELLPGGEAWAQILLGEPMAVVPGDRFIIRDANETLAGGSIVAAEAKRHPRRRESVIAELVRLSNGDPAEAVYAAIAAREPVEAETAFRSTDLTNQQAAEAFERLLREGRLIALGASDGQLIYTQPGFDKRRRAALDATQAYIHDHPLRSGITKEELRSRLDMSQRVFALFLTSLASSGNLEDRGLTVAPPAWQPGPTDAQQQAADAYLTLLRASPFAPPTDQKLNDELVAYLVEKGEVVDAGAGVVFTTEAYNSMVEIVVTHLRTNESVTLAQVRDLLGTSRRYVQSLLDEMDEQRITIRRGDERVLRHAP